MKKLIAALLFFIAIMCANTYAEEIKVGLGTASQYKIGGKTEIGYLKNAVYIPCDLIPDYTYLTFTPAEGSYFRSKDIFDSFAAAKECSLDYEDAYPAISDKDEWYVYKKTAADGFETSTILSNASVFAYEGDKLAFIADLPSNIQISMADGSFVEYNNASYRGRIELFRKNGMFTVINNVDIEDYLRSVVPAEMPASWNTEALKAQAAVARTYAFYNRDKHGPEGYSVCTTQHCQSYKGAEYEYPDSDSAIAATANVMVYYDNSPINAVYSSSSGGYSADAKDVWGSSVAYLKGVKDGFDTTDQKWTRTFTFAQLSNLAGNIGTVKSVTIKTGSRSGRVKELDIIGTGGSKTVTGENIRSFFAGAGGSLKSTRFTLSSAGPVMYPPSSASRSSSPQVSSSINIISADGSISQMPGDDIIISDSNGISENKLLQFMDSTLNITKVEKYLSADTANSVNSLPVETSENEDIVVSTTSADPLTLYGAGYGHGVGMSQYGAKRMAEAGYNYIQILKFYYKGVSVG